MKKIVSVGLVIIYGFVALSCANKKERNVILFKDNTATVQNTLLNIKLQLDSLPEFTESAEVVPHYVLSNNYLYINQYQKMKFTDSAFIPGFSESSRKNFIKSISFLKKNYISGAFNSLHIWLFEYHKLFNEEHDAYRYIVVINKSSDTVNLSKQYKILDKKENLLLVALKDARIDK